MSDVQLLAFVIVPLFVLAAAGGFALWYGRTDEERARVSKRAA